MKIDSLCELMVNQIRPGFKSLTKFNHQYVSERRQKPVRVEVYSVKKCVLIGKISIGRLFFTLIRFLMHLSNLVSCLFSWKVQF
jgi:hypothetical protein